MQDNRQFPIQITGLNPGEKLNEELLITEKFFSTSNPKIIKAKETKLEFSDLDELITDILEACDNNDINRIIKLGSMSEIKLAHTGAIVDLFANL